MAATPSGPCTPCARGPATSSPPLVDVRDDEDVAATQALADELGLRIDVASLSRGRVRLPADAADRAAGPSPRTPSRPSAGTARRRRPRDAAPVPDLGAAGWPAGVRETAGHGLGPAAAEALSRRRQVAATVAQALPGLPAAEFPAEDGAPSSCSATRSHGGPRRAAGTC